MAKKILCTVDGEVKSYLVDTAKDFHTKEGIIKKEDFNKKVIKTNKGIQFYCFDPTFIDLFNKIKRGAQIMLPKDIATIIAESGLNNQSIVVDAGTGSGALASFLALHAKKVYTFDNRPEHLEVAKKTFEFLGVKNVVVKDQDVYEKKVAVKNADLVTLDLREPWRALPNVTSCLKKGGFLIAYNPQITQAQELVNVLEKNGLLLIKVVENIQREWEIYGQVVRPKFGRIAHTGFIVIARKI
ncbi:MAG: methyltransferase domain-containing protein [Nanoarchaeota archaeon]|nr:methyltransferase domain-containing protein [Nanoarchaeota archaeon]